MPAPKRRTIIANTILHNGSGTSHILWDVVVGADGKLITASVPSADTVAFINIIDSSGKNERGIHLHNLLEYPFLNKMMLEFNQSTNTLLVLYKSRNLLQLYHPDGRLLRELSIDGIPPVAKYSKHGANKYQVVPDSFIFLGLASDTQGRIYVLGGHYSRKPLRTIYVLSSAGSMLGTITLPSITLTMYIDN